VAKVKEANDGKILKLDVRNNHHVSISVKE
jgi:hypothetical protein